MENLKSFAKFLETKQGPCSDALQAAVPLHSAAVTVATYFPARTSGTGAGSRLHAIDLVAPIWETHLWFATALRCCLLRSGVTSTVSSAAPGSAGMGGSWSRPSSEGNLPCPASLSLTWHHGVWASIDCFLWMRKQWQLRLKINRSIMLPLFSQCSTFVCIW